MRDGPQRRDRVGRLVGAALALGLAAAVLALAGPAALWRLLRASHPAPLALAFAGFGVATVLRGFRLTLLLPSGRLPPGRAPLVAAAAQAAALFLPLRTGELVLPLLLARHADWELTAGVSTLLAARTLDLATLGVWAGASALLVAGLGGPAAALAVAALLLPALALPVAVGAADRAAVRCLAPRGVGGRRWARRVRRLRRALEELARRPGRLALAALASLGLWGATWGYTWLLLAAIGYRWPVPRVIAGSAVASLTNLLPVNLVANLGTLEAGWTAAFSALGVPVDQAAASGLACHLWALVFAALLGAIGWLTLGPSHPKS